MLAFAYQHGHDTPNGVELRKDLAEEKPRRGQAEFLGLQFKVI